jgi:DNA repair protein RadC
VDLPHSQNVRTDRLEQTKSRIRNLGTDALSDVELLALLLPDGDARLDLGRLFEDAGGLKGLHSRTQAELVLLGLSEQEALRFLAALQLGRRSCRAFDVRPRLVTPEQIFEYLAPALTALRREVFHVLSFNSRNVLLDDSRVAQGTLNACPVDPRDVFGAALSAKATAVVLAHNHPSGDPEPSSTDLHLTQQLTEGATILGIQLLDHISRSLPDMMWLTSMVQNGPELTIQGRTTTLIALSDFVANLGTNPLLIKPIQIDNSETDKAGGAQIARASAGQPPLETIKFTVKAQVAGVAPKGRGGRGAAPARK